MKKYLALFSLVLLVNLPGILTPASGQWPKHIIDDNLDLAVSVEAADLDGDTKLDLLVADYGGSRLFWYQNNYPFWIKHIIAKSNPTFAYSGDIDGDDTLDVVASLYKVGQIVWYENSHPTWTRHLIAENTENTDFMLVADIDDDDTPDVVTAGFTGGGDVVWYENNHPDWIEHIIESGSEEYPSLNVTDMDGDGLLDVVATMSEANKVVWFRNENKGLTWTKYDIDDSFNNAFGLNNGDIDGDGSMDIVATAGGPYYSGSDVVWYENHHPTWTKHVIDTALSGADWPYVTDVDSDDTMDVIVTGYVADDLVWYENNHPVWTKHVIDDNLDGARLVTSADMDEDKINDAIVTSKEGVAWYKNPYTTAAYGESLEVYPYYIQSLNDTLTIRASVSNPENHPVNVYSVIQGDQTQFIDSLQLFDDGLHSDDDSSDNVWGNRRLATGLPEDAYRVDIITYDSTFNTPFFSPPAEFITFGPVTFEYYSFKSPEDTGFYPGKNTFITITLKNNSNTATAANIQAHLISPNPLWIDPLGNRNFENMVPGESSTSDNIYLIKISNECPGDTLLPITVNITYNDAIAWSETFSINVNNPVSIKDIIAPVFRIYPNPVNDMLTIETDYMDHHSIEITSLNGQLIYRGKMEGTSQQIDLSSFQKGVYFITVRSDKTNITEKIIKY